jgi:tRNA threonylcarbamoyladenosine biosynthesis protein TsaB
MKAVLSIDTTSNEIIKVGLNINGEEYNAEQKLDQQKAQAVLPLIEKMLEKKKIKLQGITEIKINPGPGSFTGIRVGLTVANTLAFLLKVPINGKTIGEMVEPVYK